MMLNIKRNIVTFRVVQKIILSALLVLFSHQSIAVDPLSAIASISFARGSSVAVQTGQIPRVLGKGDSVYPGDNIQTSKRSFVIITFNDGAKIAICSFTLLFSFSYC